MTRPSSSGRGGRPSRHHSTNTPQRKGPARKPLDPARRAAFDVLAGADVGAGGRRIAVLGDMLELGPLAEAEHRALADEITSRNIDLTYTCGPSMRACSRALPTERRGGHEADSTALAPRLVAALRPGDTVLVKGSLGSRMAVVVEAIRNIKAPLAANGS